MLVDALFGATADAGSIPAASTFRSSKPFPAFRSGTIAFHSYAPSSPLVDVFSLAAFNPGAKPGTFQSCSTTNRIDYIFVSKNLAPKVVDGGVERHGLWGAPTNKNPPSAWEIYPTIMESSQAASDHAAVSIDINI